MALLEISGLYKRFGGLSATDGVSLEVEKHELHAIIGPNGAGKTTLLAQLAGELLPDEGQIRLRGRDITRLPAYRRTHLGLARSFQITSVLADMTLLDNVALAVQAHQGHSYRFWRPARQDRRLQEPARKVLQQLGLDDRADTLAGAVSHGEHRQLEIAMALAAGPELLLLDEPMAGMGAEESATMVQILQTLKGHKTILLIEHDMDAVFALADRISVLVYGKIIASDIPEAIRRDPAVRSAYLGDQAC